MNVPLQEHLAEPLNDTERVLSEEVGDLDVKLCVAFHSLCRMEGCGHQLPVVDVETLELVCVLSRGNFRRNNLLEALSVVVEDREKGLAVALVRKHVEAGAVLQVQVVVLFDKVLWSSQFAKQVARYVPVIHRAGNVQWRTATQVFLHQALQDVILIEGLAAIREALHDLSELPRVNHLENPTGPREVLWTQFDGHVDPLLLTLHFLFNLIVI